jgi:hypothetical protein
MLNQKHTKYLALILISGLALMLSTPARAQIVTLGSFQGAGDPTDSGWIDTQDSDPITSDPHSSFVAAGVGSYPLSLQMSGPDSFGNPASLEIQLSPAQIQAFNTNSWFTFTFSVAPGASTQGYAQLYNIAFNAPGYGYHNFMSGGSPSATWGTYSEAEGATNSNQNGELNYYFYSGDAALDTETVSVNYSSITNAIIAGGEGYLQITFQAQIGGGATTTNLLFNNVFLSQNAFGAGEVTLSNVYIVDDFSTNGIGSENPTNDDWFAQTNVYSLGEITNVWDDWFGSALANSNVSWSTNDANGSAASGSLELQLSFGSGDQFVLHHVGFAEEPYVSSLTYTSLDVDVRWDPSSVTNGGNPALTTQTNANFGPLRFGVRPTTGNGGSQEWFYYTNIPAADTNWVHLVIPLSNTDPNFVSSFGEVLVGMDTTVGGWNGSGSSILYIDNIKFVGPLTAAPTPPPVMSIQTATPGLRIYAGSTVNTYDRSDLVTVDQNQSWISPIEYPVTYSFSLLSYPNNNINQTMVELIPVATLNGNATYGQEYGDYQAANGMWLVLAPNGGGAVTATVEWKTNGPAAGSNPNQIAMVFTNPTAIGTWTWEFDGPTNGRVLAPGGLVEPFTIADTNAASDFANPVIAQFGLQPNSTSGEGLYETWGFIGVTNVSDGNEYEDFTHESSDLALNDVNNYNTTPSGFFNTANSANQADQIMAVIVRTNADYAWVSWTLPANGYNLVTGTNLLLSPTNHWVTPDYYSGGNDNLAPRGNPEQEGVSMVELIPYDNAPTINGQPGGPLSPQAFFELTTNMPSTSP